MATKLNLLSKLPSGFTRLVVPASCFILAIAFASNAFSSAGKTLITGVYSCMKFNGDGGDLIGIEVWLVRSGDGYSIVFQSSEGVPSPPIVANASFSSETLTFTVPSGPYAGSTFIGRITGGILVGRFSDGKLGPDGSAEVRLSRGKSYWQ